MYFFAQCIILPSVLLPDHCCFRLKCDIRNEETKGKREGQGDEKLFRKEVPKKESKINAIWNKCLTECVRRKVRQNKNNQKYVDMKQIWLLKL